MGGVGLVGDLGLYGENLKEEEIKKEKEERELKRGET